MFYGLYAPINIMPHHPQGWGKGGDLTFSKIKFPPVGHDEYSNPHVVYFGKVGYSCRRWIAYKVKQVLKFLNCQMPQQPH